MYLLEKQKNKWCECRIKVTPVLGIIRTNYSLSTASPIYVHFILVRREHMSSNLDTLHIMTRSGEHVDEIIQFSYYFLSCETHVLSTWIRLLKKNIFRTNMKCLIKQMIVGMISSKCNIIGDLLNWFNRSKRKKSFRSCSECDWLSFMTISCFIFEKKKVFLLLFTNTIITHT